MASISMFPQWTFDGIDIIYVCLILLIGWFLYKKHAQLHCLQDKLKHLQQMDSMKDEFLANTSHELRTPINSIVGMAESLVDVGGSDLSDKVKKDLTMIINSGKRLSNLVNDILDYSKLKKVKLELNIKTVDLTSMIRVIKKLIDPLVNEKKINFVNTLEKKLPYVLADENRLQQILINLLGNAVKFTCEGSITITASVIEDYVMINIADTGIGINKDKIEQIFTAFEQGSCVIGQKYGGTGLGLTITRELVELQGGKLTLESQEGTGSIFSFTLPVSLNTPEQMPCYDELMTDIQIDHKYYESVRELEVDKMKSHKIQYVDNHSHILIVDDLAINRQLLKNFFSDSDYYLEYAVDGDQALSLISNHGPFDLVILDIMMPKMSGYELCRKIRENLSVIELPIIFLSEKNQLSDLMQGFTEGGNDYLAKPIVKKELLTRVDYQLTCMALNKVQQQENASRLEKYTVLNEMGRQLSSTLDMEDIIEAVYQNLNRLMDAPSFGIGLYNWENSSIDYQLAIEDGIRFKPYSRDMSDTNQLPVWCIEHREVVFINDLDNELNQYINVSLFDRSVEASKLLESGQSPFDPQSLIYVPLILRERVLGILTVQTPVKNRYLAMHVDILQILASYMVMAIENIGNDKIIKNNRIQ